MKQTDSHPARKCYIKIQADGSILASDHSQHPRKDWQRFPLHNSQYDLRLVVSCVIPVILSMKFCYNTHMLFNLFIIFIMIYYYLVYFDCLA